MPGAKALQCTIQSSGTGWVGTLSKHQQCNTGFISDNTGPPSALLIITHWHKVCGIVASWLYEKNVS